MFIVVFENTLLLPRSGAEAEKGELYWPAARKISSIFKTSRRCDHMMILWWLYNDHMIINDHMMIVCKFRGDTARNWGSLALESTFLGRIWGWGSRLWVLRFCGGSETQVLRLKVFGSSHATQVQVHMQLKFKFTNSRIWNFFQSPLPSSLVGKTAEVFITHTPLIVWNKENIETLKWRKASSSNKSC